MSTLNAIKQGDYTAAKNEIIKHIQDLDEVNFSIIYMTYIIISVILVINSTSKLRLETLGVNRVSLPCFKSGSKINYFEPS